MNLGKFISTTIILLVLNAVHVFLLFQIYNYLPTPSKETNEPLKALLHVLKYCLAPIGFMTWWMFEAKGLHRIDENDGADIF